MAKSSPVKKAWRSLTWLGVIIVGLIALNTAGVIGGSGSWSPKLALDLEGGTQIILAPKLESGDSVSPEQLNQAVSIIRQRIDSAGVSESEINTQGGKNIVVSIPGTPDDATINRIESSAKLEFRPVLLAAAPSGAAVGGEEATATPTPTPSVDPGSLPSTPSVKPTNASDLNYVTPALQAQYDAFDCSKIETAVVAPADKPLVTCETDGSVKYVLGPVEVSGANISDASSGQKTTQSGATTGEWVVNMVFDGEGTKDFATVTTRLSGLQGVQNQFAIVLDGSVISAPRTLAVITDGKPQISGNFTQASAKSLADQLKFGALPLSFAVQSQDTISATLGSAQLTSGLIAGLIGLILVVLYSLAQYRLLGLVTVASLVVAAVITYLLITILSWREGYRLSLAGVAGLIVAIGITADSFIVYFERVRDELRDGRGLESAVESGWKRAIRTIVVSDAVNFLAAAVLFILAVGNVRGFAFTLGLTTIVDLIVVMLFTHPMLQLLARTRFFNEGHRFSGLDPRALGAVYRGRAKFAPSPAVSTSKSASSSREAAKRQTIAERKASEMVGSSTDRSTDGKDS
ncbi:protein translocase subunit SecD [Cryobacterium tagatosivorans]|uniref:Protein translocase subunit SecD n=1 Tax=Cryobacterium tagatosivorans TaxID=1259199 RepID=A0A4R8UK53_9MICO|nr:protein translocase subunit SecD [Cryobacterium tagatosivorans]TFB55615.1 protein translocase subunit SecD [Cryobacterium tagatosivorans]